MSRTVLYGRLSSDRQAGGESKSVDDQLLSLRKWAQAEGHEIVAMHRDDGISASRYARTKVRPAWQKVMELITAGMVEVLAVWAVGRATRDRAVWSALIAACQEHGVLIAVDGKVADPSDPDDAFMLDIHAALAVQGAARISKDTRRSVDARAARGAPHGRLLDGYRVVTDKAGKVIGREIDPERAPIIREIITRLLAGETAYAIATDFNKRGVPTATGKQWSHTGISKRVKSPTLAGLRVHHGEVLEGVQAEWEPLISMEEYHRLQALLSEPGRKSHYGGSTVKHLGTGIYTCGVCESPVRVITKKRADGRRHSVYTCKGPNYCVTRGQMAVDMVVETHIVEFLARKDIYAELTTETHEEDVLQARETAARLRAELADALTLVEAGRLSVGAYARIENSLKSRLDYVEDKARPTHLPTVVYDVAGDPTEADRLAAVQARWDATPVLAKRVIITALVHVQIYRQSGTVFDPRKVVVTRRTR